MSCIRTVILWNTILLSLFVLTACTVRDLVGRWKSVPEDGVVERQLVFVQYTAMQDADFDQLNLRVAAQHNAWTEDQVPPSVRDRNKLRLLSRFPQGLSAPLLEQLLQTEGPTAVEVIGGN